MNYRYHPKALEEYEDAIGYYQEKAGLGARFSKAVETGIQRIVDHPIAWTLVDEGVRRYVVSRFPFSIYYTVEAQAILILAIFHTKRKSGSWKNRLRF